MNTFNTTPFSFVQHRVLVVIERAFETKRGVAKGRVNSGKPPSRAVFTYNSS